MATARSTDRQPSRWKRNGVLLVLVLAVALLAYSWDALREGARASTAYGARIGCVCHFVSKQPLAQCKGLVGLGDLGRTTRLMLMGSDDASGTVTASVPLLARQRAIFTPQTGCQLESWQN